MWEDVLSDISGILKNTQAISSDGKQYTDMVSERRGEGRGWGRGREGEERGGERN